MSNFEKELDGILEIIKDEKFYNSKLYALPSIEELKAHFKDWQPPKKLVVVPQIVADWFENNEDDLSFKIWGYLINWKLQDKKSDFFKWMKKETECIETLIRMQDGYTIKKEQLYEVRLPIPDSDIENDYALVDIRGNIWEDAFPTKYKLTEQEIKAIDSRYMVFAVPVDEV